jgi:hypothetical protein
MTDLQVTQVQVVQHKAMSAPGAYLQYPDLPGTPPSGVIPTIPGVTILRQETGSTRHGSPQAACQFLALEAPMARRYLLYEEADSIGYWAFRKCTGERDDLE